jgi:hypothetical protein
MTSTRGLAVCCALGFAVGALAGGPLLALYPPPRALSWLGPVLLISSVVIVGVLYTLVRRRDERAGDWIVVGYIMAALLLGGAAMSQDAVHQIRARLPSMLGGPTGSIATQTFVG